MNTKKYIYINTLYTSYLFIYSLLKKSDKRRNIDYHIIKKIKQKRNEKNKY